MVILKRYWSALLVIWNLCLSAVFLAGWTARPGSLKATDLQLVDDAGKPWARMARENGHPSFCLLGEKRDGLFLAIDEYGPRVEMLDTNGHATVLLRGDHGAGVLCLQGDNLKYSATMSAGDNGAGFYVGRDTFGPSVEANVTTQATVAVTSGRERYAATLSGPSLTFSRNGKVTHEFPPSEPPVK